MTKREDALDYHARGRPGKIAVVPTKPLTNQRDLSLAYSPGVAEPCLAIKDDPDVAYKYTARGNLVAVVTNGTAVLGLGNIGALAGKPVMEGKGNLFKQFADIDVFDLEVGSENPDDVIKFCQLLEPTVGGINLEDIKAPDCFYIEETLRKTLKIPVFHDDQHGTAIISGAALLNALEIVGKEIDQVKVVFSGAGAAAIATAEHYVRLGVKRENILMCDRAGVIYEGRDGDMDPYKARFVRETDGALASPTRSSAPTSSSASPSPARSRGEMVAQMADAPDHLRARQSGSGDLCPDEVRAVRDDAIIATGPQRLSEPGQQRPRLPVHLPRRARRARHRDQRGDEDGGDARARRCSPRRTCPTRVAALYGLRNVHFGADYLIPFPFDPRVLLWVAPAVAWAAVASGVATRVHRPRGLSRAARGAARSRARRHARPHQPRQSRSEAHRLPRGRRAEDHPRRRAARRGRHRAADPARQRDDDRAHRARCIAISLDDIAIEDPSRRRRRRDEYAHYMWQLRQRKGLSLDEARRQLYNGNYFGSCMVARGDADALLSGVNLHYPETIRPALQVIGAHPEARSS